MPDKNFSQLILEERIELFKKLIIFHVNKPPQSARELLTHFAQGRLAMELYAGYLIGMLPSSELHDINAHVPKTVRQLIRLTAFEISTNQAFDRVMNECARPRSGSGHGDMQVWIGDRMRNHLLELNRMGHAHSVEIWQGRQFTGGILLLQVNSLCICLSVCSRQSGAGNAAYVGLKEILRQEGFLMLDTIVPSTISRLFGGRRVAAVDAMAQRKLALQKTLTFPTFPAKLLTLDAPEPARPDNAQRVHGRPFTF